MSPTGRKHVSGMAETDHFSHPGKNCILLNACLRNIAQRNTRHPAANPLSSTASRMEKLRKLGWDSSNYYYFLFLHITIHAHQYRGESVSEPLSNPGNFAPVPSASIQTPYLASATWSGEVGPRSPDFCHQPTLPVPLLRSVFPNLTLTLNPNLGRMVDPHIAYICLRKFFLAYGWYFSHG